MLSLKQARLLKGINQEEIARKLGIHVQTYRRIEYNSDLATIGQAKKISKIIELPYDEIFFGENSTLSRKRGEAQ